ncbi:hypothetical protein CASFOL_035866 [Castilleja foliolosa]|uniref:GH10 domain-containing protein n=1 Tax=Castilleja foliolosa TaxID=1961234 RepID=A0ABD3BUH9_9LAMI
MGCFECADERSKQIRMILFGFTEIEIKFDAKMFVILCSLLLTGCCAITVCGDVPYDYSANIDCLPEPLPPQYNGGIVKNPNIDLGPHHWSPFGNASIISRQTQSGNNFLVAFGRSEPFDSFTFWTDIQNDVVYVFSAWVQVDRGIDDVSAFYTGIDNSSIMIGSVIAKFGCWSMLKGGFTANQDIKANFHFSSNNTEAELWVDSVSLQPFNKLEWQAHQNQMIEQVRKRKLKIYVESRDGQKLPGAKITIDQTRPKFPIGSGSPDTILTNKAYQEYFTARFTAVTLHNELKWYFTESVQDHENYTIADNMVEFFKKHKIGIRGHTILWASTSVTQWWVKQMQPKDVLKAAVRRVGSVVSRYSGDIIGWDVMNENLHNSFYEEKLGSNASAMVYQIVHAMDPTTPLFLNEYNTIELPTDLAVTPSKYVAKYREMRAFPGNENLSIYFGLQGHFYRKPMVSHIRAVFDILGATGMKIWITELDTRRGPLQAKQLEEVMREAYAHPAVEGIIVWGGWKPTGCNQTCLEDPDVYHLAKGCAEMCLVDNNFNNLPPGDTVDKLIKEWKTTDVKGVTDENGVFEHNVFLGEYAVTFTHPEIPRFGTKTFSVPSGEGPFELRVLI